MKKFMTIIGSILLFFSIIGVLSVVISGKWGRSDHMSAISEEARQKSTFSNPVIGFFSLLFNDTNSANPIADLQKGIEQKFDPKTYFADSPGLLSAASSIMDHNISTLQKVLKDTPVIATESTDDGYSLLYFAILNNNVSAIRVILDSGANANQIYTSKDGSYSTYNTPMTYLLNNYESLGSLHPDENMTLSIIDMLVSHGAKLNTAYASDAPSPPLSLVTLDWEQNLFKKLITLGADINIQLFAGKTLLYKAVDMGDLDKVAFLLAQGADPKIKATNGMAPADALCKNVQKLKKEGRFSDSEKEQTNKIAQLLTSKGASLSCEI